LPATIQPQPGEERKKKHKFRRGNRPIPRVNAATITFSSVKQATFQLFERDYGLREFEPEIWSMRHPLPLRERINWRLVALLIAILTLCLAGALYSGGETRTAAQLGPGWSCTPNLLGTVCVRNVSNTALRTRGT
jgi:hypothetical protein